MGAGIPPMLVGMGPLFAFSSDGAGGPAGFPTDQSAFQEKKPRRGVRFLARCNSTQVTGGGRELGTSVPWPLGHQLGPCDCVLVVAHSGWPWTPEKLSCGGWIELERPWRAWGGDGWGSVYAQRQLRPVAVTQLEVLRQRRGPPFP